MKHLDKLACFFFLSILVQTLTGQQDDPVLFSVNDDPVTVSEFKYIYEKTTSSGNDQNELSLEEYLDLYTKFKLKIAEAKSRGLDTVASLNYELEGYRKQLAENYLMDKEVLEELTKEAYERVQYDVELAHILIIAPADKREGSLFDQKIMDVHAELEKGMTFEDVAKKYSDEVSTRDKGGYLGWRTAILPKGFYDVETAAYNTPVGSYSKPVQSRVGYHIIKVLNKRPARGKIKVAHIAMKHSPTAVPSKSPKSILDSVYTLLKNGDTDFDEMARKYSQDKKTNQKGGVLPWFGIHTYQKEFEDAAFALENDGDISIPVETKYGYHIIKRIEADPIESYAKEKRALSNQIKNNERYDLTVQSLVQKIKENNDFKSEPISSDEFYALMGDNPFRGDWKKPGDLEERTLFTFDGETYTIAQLADYMESKPAFRLKHGLGNDKDKSKDAIIDDFAKVTLLKHEEDQLEENYPEFKTLMREYREGILLFEVQKEEVWDKAVEDTAGLKAFYANNKERYVGDPQVEMLTLTVNSQEPKTLAKVSKLFGKKGVEAVKKKFNKVSEVISSGVTTAMAPELEAKGYMTKKGYIGKPENIEGGKAQISQITNIIPGQLKPFSKIRGNVIVDYQEHLESAWIDELMKKHSLDINEDVFQQMYK